STSDPVIVEEIGEAVDSIRKLADGGAHHPLAVVLKFPRVAMDPAHSVLTGDIEQTVGAAPVGHHLRQQVALTLDWCAHVGQKQAHQRPVHAACPHEQYWWNPNAFLINFASERHGPGTHTAD